MADTELAVDSLRASDAYRLMIDLIAPRPIAWISSQDQHGRRNLAPFSYFQAVCSSPPMLVVSIGSRPDGAPKDSLANILETGDFVVNHVSEPLAEAMNATSAPYPRGVSEWEAVGIAAAPSAAVAPPRVAGSLASFECRLTHAMPLGVGRNGAPSTTLIVARVVHIAVVAGLLRRDAQGRLDPIDPAQLAAVGRLGGMAYTTTEGRFDLPRPTLPTRDG